MPYLTYCHACRDESRLIQIAIQWQHAVMLHVGATAHANNNPTRLRRCAWGQEFDHDLVNILELIYMD